MRQSSVSALQHFDSSARRPVICFTMCTCFSAEHSMTRKKLSHVSRFSRASLNSSHEKSSSCALSTTRFKRYWLKIFRIHVLCKVSKIGRVKCTHITVHCLYLVPSFSHEVVRVGKPLLENLEEFLVLPHIPFEQTVRNCG